MRSERAAPRRVALLLFLLVPLLSAAPARAQVQPASLVPHCTFAGFISPGQSIQKGCVAVNVFLSDASVHHFVNQDSIRVFDERDNVVTGPDHDTFVGFFRLSVSTQRILTYGDPSNGEADDTDVAPLHRLARPYRSVCDQKRLTELTGDMADLDATACRVGRVRALGSHYPQREYLVVLHMLDEGDQTRFSGWGIQFNEIQRLTTPARTDCGYWTCDPAGPGLYER